MSLKYVAAYLMATLAGKEQPSKSDVKTILGAVDAECDDALLSKLMSAVADKSATELISAGLSKLQAVPSGGAVAAPAASGAAAADAAPAAEAAKEEEEEEEEEEGDFGLGLFD